MIKSIIVDIDGTLSDQEERHNKSLDATGNKDWDIFLNPEEIIKDPQIESVCEMYRLFQRSGYEMILVTARKENVRKITEQWLQKNDIIYSYLYMRDNEDNRKDCEVKLDIYNKHLKDKNIYFAIEDRLRVCKLWQNLGIKVFNVGNNIDW